MASKELSDFQQNLGVTGQNLTRVELQVNELRDDIAPVRFVLGKISEFKDIIGDVKRTSEQLETTAKALGSVPKVGIIAKRLADVIDRFGDAAEVIENKLKALETAAEPVKTVLDKVNTGLVRTDAVLDGSITLTDNLIASAAEAETAIENIASLENPDGTMMDVSHIEDCFDDLLRNPNALLAVANESVANAEARIGQFTNLITPPDIDFSGIELIADDLAEIGEIFDSLEAPFDAISVAIEPIAWAFDAVDFVINSVVSPVIDPLLEALGVEDLIDDAVEKLLDLLPGVDLIDPLDGLLEDAAEFLDGLDPTLTDAAFSLQLDDFLSLTEFLGIFVPDDTRVSDGLPLGYDLFGLNEVKADFWTSVLEGSYEAAVAGGLVVGFQADTSLAGNIGADYLFGGLADDTLVNSADTAAMEDPTVVNTFQGNGGDDTMFAYGRTIVTYKGDIGEYLISQPEDDTEPRYVDIQHIAKAGTPESEGTDRIYFDDQTLIKFGRLPVFNMETFLLGYQAATPDMPNLTGDPVDNPNDDLPGLRDFLIGNTTDFPAPGLDQANELLGLLRDDFLSGGNGDDRLFGGEDDDYLVGGNGFDTLDGGPGIDTASFVDLTAPVFAPFGTTAFGNNGTRGAQLFLDRSQVDAQSLGFFLTDLVVDVENVIGSQFRDIVFGESDQSNILLGEEEDDILRGVGASADGQGNLLAGGDGQDVLILDSGKDIGTGEAGDDRFYVPLQAQFTGLGNTIDGGEGTDLLSYSGFDTIDIFDTANGNEEQVLFFGADFFGIRYGDNLDLSLTTVGGSVVIDTGAATVTRVLETGERAVDAYTQVETILGTAGNDTINASQTPDEIDLHGGAGNDLFLGLGSDLNTEGARDFTFQGNTLFGGSGDDLFQLSGAHGVDGGVGIDTLDISGSDGYWLIVAPELTQDSGRSWGASGIEHFETVFELPPDLELQDLFVVPNLIENPDLPPAFEDPSDPSNPFILTFDSPNEAPQIAQGIEIFIGTDRRDVIIGGRDALTVDGG
ncbi:MAG: calcium-binding protein, partial [Pseudomonadota bacterium]